MSATSEDSGRRGAGTELNNFKETKMSVSSMMPVECLPKDLYD